jgi:hypothetical protein
LSAQQPIDEDSPPKRSDPTHSDELNEERMSTRAPLDRAIKSLLVIAVVLAADVDTAVGVVVAEIADAAVATKNPATTRLSFTGFPVCNLRCTKGRTNFAPSSGIAHPPRCPQV